MHHRVAKIFLRKISKTGAARGQMIRLKGTKFDFHWGFTPDTAGGACSIHPTL